MRRMKTRCSLRTAGKKEAGHHVSGTLMGTYTRIGGNNLMLISLRPYSRHPSAYARCLHELSIAWRTNQSMKPRRKSWLTYHLVLELSLIDAPCFRLFSRPLARQWMGPTGRANSEFRP